MSTVLFVQDRNLFYLEYGIMLARLRAEGFTVDVLFKEKEGDRLLDRIRERNPIMIGTFTDCYELYIYNGSVNFALVEEIKAALPHIPTFVCGIHSTISPDFPKLYPKIDLCFVGDVENSLPKAARCIENNGDLRQVDGISFWDNGVLIRNKTVAPTDLGSLPPPYFDPFFASPGAFRLGLRFAFSRGCINRCSFCYMHKYKEYTGTEGMGVRYYPVPYLMDALKQAAKHHADGKVIYFTYGTFTASKEFTREFCQAFRDSGLPMSFVIATRLDRVDEEIARWLKEANCSKVSVAIESGVERLRNKVLRKGLTDKMIFEGMAALHKHGLRVGTGIMLGFPGETIDDAFASLDMAHALKADFINVGFFVPVPGLDLTDHAVQSGLLSANIDLSALEWGESNLALPDQRLFENLSELSSLYVKYPLKPLFRFLIRLPRNRLYFFFKMLPRIEAALTFDLVDKSVFSKIRYLAYSLSVIFFRRERPNLVSGNPSRISRARGLGARAPGRRRLGRYACLP